MDVRQVLYGPVSCTSPFRLNLVFSNERKSEAVWIADGNNTASGDYLVRATSGGPGRYAAAHASVWPATNYPAGCHT